MQMFHIIEIKPTSIFQYFLMKYVDFAKNKNKNKIYEKIFYSLVFT